MLWNITSQASRAERQKHLAWVCLNEQISIVRVIALCSVMHLLFAVAQPKVSWAKNTAWYCTGGVSSVVSQHFGARELTLPRRERVSKYSACISGPGSFLPWCLCKVIPCVKSLLPTCGGRGSCGFKSCTKIQRDGGSEIRGITASGRDVDELAPSHFQAWWRLQPAQTFCQGQQNSPPACRA